MQRTLSKVMNLITPSVITSSAQSPGLEVHDQALTQSLVSTPITQPEVPEALVKTLAVKKPRKVKEVGNNAADKKLASKPGKNVLDTKIAKVGKTVTKPKAKAVGKAKPDNKEVLTAAEAKQWTACRAKLNESDEARAEALADILENRLYREKYRSFEKFVQAECIFGKAYAYRLIQAHKILKASTFVDGQKPTNIAQAIALAAAPEAKYPEVMREAVKLAGAGKPTTVHIKNAIKLLAPKPKAPGKANGNGGGGALGGEGAGPDKAAKTQPVKLTDALGWVTSLRANIKDPAKVEASLALLDLLELALQSNTLIDAPAGKPAAGAVK
jgi:hypothetical protein